MREHPAGLKGQKTKKQKTGRQPMAERAMRWLRRLAGRGSMVLLGDPGRAHVPGIGLCELARYDVPTSQDLEGRERCDGFVWRVLAR